MATTPTTTNHKVFNVNTVDEFNQILQTAVQHDILVFVKFGAKWCAPCKKIAPFYERIANIYLTSIFLYVDVDKFRAISTRYNIKSVPTFIVCRNNRHLELMKGADANKLYELVKNQISMQ